MDKFTPNRAAIRKLLAMPGLDDVLVERAEVVAGRARSAAPHDTGAYAASIVARAVPGRTKRRAAEVAATVPHAGRVEARHRVLGRSL